MTAISAGNNGKGSFSFAGGYGAWTTDTVEPGVLGSYANNYDATIIASAQPDSVYFKNAVRFTNSNGEVSNIAYEDQIVNREGSDDEYPEDKQKYLKDVADDDSAQSAKDYKTFIESTIPNRSNCIRNIY